MYQPLPLGTSETVRFSGQADRQDVVLEVDLLVHLDERDVVAQRHVVVRRVRHDLDDLPLNGGLLVQPGDADPGSSVD